ncbi:MAG: hypothetical protein ACLRNZ_02030 [Blautia massiliensis (ex Durand et al. 2017)]
MNQNFVEYVKSHIKEYLPTEYQNAVISINEVTKSNDRMLTGLTILSPGEQVCTNYLFGSACRTGGTWMPLDTADETDRTDPVGKLQPGSAGHLYAGKL